MFVPAVCGTSLGGGWANVLFFILFHVNCECSCCMSTMPDPSRGGVGGFVWGSVQVRGKSKDTKFTLQMSFIDCNHIHLSGQFIRKYCENPLSARSNHNGSFT